MNLGYDRVRVNTNTAARRLRWAGRHRQPSEDLKSKENTPTQSEDLVEKTVNSEATVEASRPTVTTGTQTDITMCEHHSLVVYNH